MTATTPFRQLCSFNPARSQPLAPRRRSPPLLPRPGLASPAGASFFSHSRATSPRNTPSPSGSAPPAPPPALQRVYAGTPLPPRFAAASRTASPRCSAARHFHQRAPAASPPPISPPPPKIDEVVRSPTRAQVCAEAAAAAADADALADALGSDAFCPSPTGQSEPEFDIHSNRDHQPVDERTLKLGKSTYCRGDACVNSFLRHDFRFSS